MTGVFAVSRGVFDHAFFSPEPYTEREAWLWLVGNAAWKPKRVRIGSTMIDLQRGQCAYAERFMAEKWKWPKTRVHRFLERLKTEAMIEPQPDRAATRITICNYDKFAFDGTASGPQTGPEFGPQVDRKWTKEEELKKDKKKINTHKARVGPLPSDWKVPARAYEIATAMGVDADDLALGFRDYLASTGKQYADYDAAFCNWVRNSQRFGRSTGPPRKSAPTLKETKQQDWQNARAKLKEFITDGAGQGGDGGGPDDGFLPAITRQ